MLRLFLILIAASYSYGFNKTFLGCYIKKPLTPTFKINHIIALDECIEECAKKYYRYTLVKAQEPCMCGNFLGKVVNKTDTCTFCENCSSFVDVYATGIKVPGPPRNLAITDITNTSATITWQEPESFSQIDWYQIKVNIIHTYSGYAYVSPEWKYSNNTFQAKIITLFPATKYNITICAISPDGEGALTSKIIQTEIGEPDNPPAQPTIASNDGKTMTIKMEPVVNNNGPITSYRIVVVNEDELSFQPQEVKPYNEAKKHGDTYYVAAEIKPEDINKQFVIGDGRYYGEYYNAPLDPDRDYTVRLGVVSRMIGTEMVKYSSLSNVKNGVLVLDVDNDEGDPPGVIVGLSIAIGLLSFMLVAGIIGFIILKSHIANRRQHFSDNQELTLQGPMIEVENNGYIHEEDHPPVNHYSHLKQKVRAIPPSHLKIEPTNLLGVGKFGRVNSGTLHENDTFVPVAVYSIADKKLTSDDKKFMLKELDSLIKTGSHENIIRLIGTSETAQIVCVALEYVSMNLKDLLLGSRDSLPGRFSNMSEIQALNIALQIAKGMTHLEQLKIVHKQLCARSVMVANGFIPKISGYGLAQFYSHNKIPDYTRWTALEVFMGQQPNSKSDSWSFACLFWEICVLGGTPYGNVPNNNEIPDKIIKGLRLPQMQYFSDDLYQIMLNCWQIDLDERPTFYQLIHDIESLKDNSLIPNLSFSLYPNFQYEQFYPDMELAVRPMF